VHLARYLRLVTRWWWLLLLGALIGGGSAYGISRLITPVYRASATLLINQTQTPGIIAYNDILTSERLTMTYRELITKRPVLEKVTEGLQLPLSADVLASMTDVAVVSDTQLLRLSVEHEEPGQARLLANTIAQAFIQSNAEDGLTRPGTVSIVEPATTPGSPVHPRTTLNTAIGALAGLFIALVVIIVYEYLDDTIKTAEDVEQAAGLPTLGGVARFPRSARGGDGLVVASPDRRTSAAEAYRVLRTNLQFSTLDAQALLISSAGPREGKTTTTANLAVAIAQTGVRAIVVDSDLRRPALHRIFGLSNGAGLTSALLSREPGVGRFLQPTRFENLSVLTSGPLPPNPSELLSSRRMDAVVDALRKESDLILFDSPPALAVADASILAGKVDGAILVVDTGTTRALALQRAAEALARSKTKILGTVLNKLSDRGHGYYAYSYHYYSSTDGANGEHGRRLPFRRRSRATKKSTANA
jgi:capsular exopolysaccharide synthesis family protein